MAPPLPPPPPPPSSHCLSFSLTPMEMFAGPTHSHFLHYDPPPHYYFDNFYANGWTNPKSEIQSRSEMEQSIENRAQQNMEVVPKLEDFFETEARDHHDSSSLTQIYENGGGGGGGAASGYFNDQQDLNAIAEFQAFSAATNSGSEVDDSATRGAHSDGGGGGSSSYNKGTLSLGAAVNSGKAVVAVADAGGSAKKAADNNTVGQRTSVYRGVTRHRWTGRYEAHLWDNSCRREGQARKGRQVYLGGYDEEEKAARAYDLAALKYWGPTATTNFPVSNYTKEIEEMERVGKQEFIASLRRKSSGFSRGASMYRGVTRHHQQGRWQARIGRVAGNKDLYLGTFATEEEAAEAYDIAAIKFRGLNAVTNFEMSRYDVEAIMNNSLPVGGAAKRLKISLEAEEKEAPPTQQPESANASSRIDFSTIQPPVVDPAAQFDPAAAYYYHHNLLHHFYPTNAVCGTAKSAPAVTMPNETALPAAPEFYIWPHQSY